MLYKNTKEKAERVLKLFEEGVILTKICEITSSSQFTVKKILRSLGIDYDKWAEEDYQRRLDLVSVLYQQNKPQIYIEKNLRLTRKTIRNILKNKEEILYKNKSEQWRLRWGSSLKENCFDELTSDVLYWIGFLYADGHIRFPGKEVSIELGIDSKDTDHMEKYKLFLGCDKPLVFPKNKNMVSLKIYSKKIYDRLTELGFKHNKSYTAVPHVSVKNSRDFWRGVVDGDGGVYDRKDTPHLFLCGTLETIFGFIIFCSKYCSVEDKYPTKSQKSRSLYQVSYYGQDAIKIATTLYENSDTFLERKYQKYLQIKTREKIN